MKVKKRWIAVITLLLAGGVGMKSAAQESIDALVKKCDSLENVEINIVRNRHPETKELTRSIVNITIPASNQALIDDFLAAFHKEREQAKTEMENRNAGKTVSLFYRFDKKSYSFSLSSRHASVRIIYKDPKKRE
jgi:hypothetical protein